MHIDKSFYRPDIDGLRAIAVLVVVIFHINPKWLAGGFLGVDIFFVISGFLITSIIRKSINKKTFSYKEFYLKRIKRILPAFYVVTVTTLIVAYFLYSPIDYRSVANSSLASTLFLGNFRFALMGDYFQSDATKPLLHYWSLSVEEQFYFLWPTCLIVLSALLKKHKFILLATLLLALISFLAAEYFSSHSIYATFSYFMLPTRMGELLTGCALAYLPKKLTRQKLNNALSTTGLALLLASLILIDKHSVFPGINAIYPCLGAAMIIYAGPNTIVNKALSLKPMVFIGLLSYSLYLWHWPFITFIKYSIPGVDFSILQGIVITAILIIISYLSLIFIEDKARKSGLSSKNAFIFLFVAPSTLLFIISLYISKTGGLPQRFNLTQKMTTIETIGCHGSLSTDMCFLSEKKSSPHDILLVGDSHAGHFSHFIKKLSDKNDFSAIDASSPGCKFYSSSAKDIKCENAKEKIQSLLPLVHTVIIAKRFDDIYMQSEFLSEFSQYINTMESKVDKIIVLAQIPKHANEKFLNRYMKSRSLNKELVVSNIPDNHYQKANNAVHKLLMANSSVKFLEINTIFCTNDKCLQIDEKGMPLYFDDDHLTAYGAEWAYSKFEKSEQYRALIHFIKN